MEAAGSAMADVQSAAGSATAAVPDVLAALEQRVASLEAAAKSAADAIGLGGIVDPIAARLDALEQRALHWDAAHPIVGKLADVVSRLFPMEMR
jgi:hypothetical protein